MQEEIVCHKARNQKSQRWECQNRSILNKTMKKLEFPFKPNTKNVNKNPRQSINVGKLMFQK